PRSPRRFGKARSSTPASCSSTAGSSGVCEGLGDVMLVTGHQQTEAHDALLRHLSGGGDAAMICRVSEEAQDAKEFLSAASWALGAEQREGHLLILVSQDPKAGKALLKALRRPPPQEEEEEEVSDEDRERKRYEERVIRQMERKEGSSLYRIIIDAGGIQTGDDLREESRGIPNAYKRRDGLARDVMAEYLKEHHPEFGISDERSLIDVLARGRW
ncbi:MAG: hypothetical protein M3P49_09355, partial [Actinomycetota bacterium]|nr:hypothetical protein [Actinomycetota bacterium]